MRYCELGIGWVGGWVGGWEPTFFRRQGDGLFTKESGRDHFNLLLSFIQKVGGWVGGWVGDVPSEEERATDCLLRRAEATTFKGISSCLCQKVDQSKGMSRSMTVCRRKSRLSTGFPGWRLTIAFWVGGWVGGWVGWRRTRRLECAAVS